MFLLGFLCEHGFPPAPERPLPLPGCEGLGFGPVRPLPFPRPFPSPLLLPLPLPGFDGTGWTSPGPPGAGPSRPLSSLLGSGFGPTPGPLGGEGPAPSPPEGGGGGGGWRGPPTAGGAGGEGRPGIVSIKLIVFPYHFDPFPTRLTRSRSGPGPCSTARSAAILRVVSGIHVDVDVIQRWTSASSGRIAWTDRSGSSGRLRPLRSTASDDSKRQGEHEDRELRHSETDCGLEGSETGVAREPPYALLFGSRPLWKAAPSIERLHSRKHSNLVTLRVACRCFLGQVRKASANLRLLFHDPLLQTYCFTAVVSVGNGGAKA